METEQIVMQENAPFTTDVVCDCEWRKGHWESFELIGVFQVSSFKLHNEQFFVEMPSVR